MVEALVGADDGGPLTLRIPRNAVARKVVHLAKLAGGHVEGDQRLQARLIGFAPMDRAV